MYPNFKETLVRFERTSSLGILSEPTPFPFTDSRAPNLDILIKADAQNARKVLAALAQFGALLNGMTAADFAERGPFFRMGRERSALTF
jgi:hypothetical protein